VLDSCRNQIEERAKDTSDSSTSIKIENIDLKAKLNQANIKMVYLESKVNEMSQTRN
jgi:hypothetical protein